jgi:hypothetical protein
MAIDMKVGAVINGGANYPIRNYSPIIYHRKWVSGKIGDIGNKIINLISCFGNNKIARERPDWVAVSKYGRATRKNMRHRFLWDWICPSEEEYRDFLLDLIKETAAADIAGVHLDCISFPRQEYCTCQRCVEKHEESNLGWVEWRAKVVNDFIEEASRRVRGNGKTFSVTLTPDPYFGKERYGEDVLLLSEHVDFFCVPLYDMTYSSEYWVETLTYGFRKQLEKPFYIWIYTANPGPPIGRRLLEAIAVACEYTDGIILASYDTPRAEEVWDEFSKDQNILGFLDRRGCEEFTSVIRKKV